MSEKEAKKASISNRVLGPRAKKKRRVVVKGQARAGFWSRAKQGLLS